MTRSRLSELSVGTLALRDYTPDDAEQVVRLLTPPLRELYPEGEAWLARRLRDIAAGQASSTLATFNGQLVGVIIVTPKNPGRVKISTLYVTTEARGLGIGKQLLKKTLSRLREQGVGEVYITVAHSVADHVEPLLNAEGFTRLAYLPNRYGPDRDEIVYGGWLL